MIFGDKKKFALEFEFDEFYKNDFVALGTYCLYINGFCYGEKSPAHSWFGGVVFGFKKLLSEKKNYGTFFSQYSDLEIIKTIWHFLWDVPFPSSEKIIEDDDKIFLGMKGRDFRNAFYNLSNRSEAHFDDGSNILLFNNDKFVKLLGYRDLGLDETEDVVIGDVNSIIIPRKEFYDIIQESFDYILSQRDEAVKNGNACK
jgi:hypothetical protein